MPFRLRRLWGIMTTHYKEELLHFIWQFQLFHSPLLTLSGERVNVIDPGVSNPFNGPDFQMAKIRVGKTQHIGSIEIHRTASDWYRHGHHKDSRYNNVILHVCYSAKEEVQRKDGTCIATLNLANILPRTVLLKYQQLMASQAFIPCEAHLGRVPALTMEQAKARMLTERMESRFKYFEKVLLETQNNWNEMWYRCFLIAFCKPYHHELMVELGKLISYKLLLNYRSTAYKLEALLLGTCGLLQAHASDEYHQRLQDEFEFLKIKHQIKGIQIAVQTRSIRPRAQAKYKLVQLCSLLQTHPSDAFDWIKTSDDRKAFFPQRPLSNYWLSYFAIKFGDTPPSIVSLGQQNQLLINFIEPFKLFYRTRRQQAILDPLHYFEKLPSENNTILNKMKGVGITIRSAACSQALLHLYKDYCKNKACLRCVIGKTLLIKDHGTH